MCIFLFHTGCGVPNREAKLIGGEFMRVHEFPWAALIQIQGEHERAVPATLINDRYVITSASNLLGLTPLDIKVTLGQFDRCVPDTSSTNTSVEKIILHPDFSPENRAHDIALIKLSTLVKIERRISPVCLASPNTRYQGQVATVFGWAETNIKEGPPTSGQTRKITSSCRPRKLGLPVLGPKECLESTPDMAYVTQDKGCIGVVGSNTPICEVDSGGPVMFRSYHGVYELIGVLVDKNECGPKPGVALFTTINDHIYWITQNTRDACYCYKS
ncbi:unnamed protein product [Acanthoscelides obtectus]|uniref:Peptidase S1 domain-containing protein n=1 Tax=Acanthoscelides obtectus TaxID=200917 RepID=A0A9P0M5B2_ACAOB|nr:unnamed protein product [Acanthoscelides obtectus]CAK1635118.1 Phenoloxidase-activating factor 1 [Acanthoscelides obtectus]